MRFILVLILLTLTPHFGFSSSEVVKSDFAYENWENTVTRADSVLLAGRASEKSLEILRDEIRNWRSIFKTSTGINSDRISLIQTQFNALPAAPADGSEDPLKVRRNELKNLINELKTPGLKANGAFIQADTLISEIDSLLRARQTDALLTSVESPLRPNIWAQAVLQSFNALFAPIREFRLIEISDVQKTNFKIQAVSIFALVLAAVASWFVGLKITNSVDSISNKTPAKRLGVVKLPISLLELLFKFVSILLIVRALHLSGLVGLKGSLFLDQLPYFSALLLFALWIPKQLFSGDVGFLSSLNLNNKVTTSSNFAGAAIVLILFDLSTTGLAQTSITQDTYSFAVLIITILASLILWRVCKSIIEIENLLSQKQDDDEQFRISFSRRLPNLIHRLLLVSLFLAPILVSVGYINAGQELTKSVILSLGLVITVIIIQDYVVDFYLMVLGEDDDNRDQLIPILLSFVLLLVSLPFFAVIWGVRQQELLEIWSNFQSGFELGTIKLSPGLILGFLIIFTIGYMLTRFIQSALQSTVLPRTSMDSGAQTAIISGVGYVGIFLAAIIAFSTTGLDLSSLAIVAGALSVGIGFGLQNIVSNFVSGIILLIERPVSVGDWIEVSGKMGYVRDISVRSTRIETFDRSDVIIPNADLVSGVVTNYTRGNTVGRLIIPVGVAYGTDTKTVETILREIAEAHPKILQDPGPSVVFQGFGSDSLDFEIRAILGDVNWMLSIKSEINHQIAERFAKEGIEIPFAQRDIWIKNPESLK
jgi:small-conductance mechanosensitive channel